MPWRAVSSNIAVLGVEARQLVISEAEIGADADGAFVRLDGRREVAEFGLRTAEEQPRQRSGLLSRSRNTFSAESRRPKRNRLNACVNFQGSRSGGGGGGPSRTRKAF